MAGARRLKDETDDEDPSESRVRENRLHGLMRGGSYLKIWRDILSHMRRKPETEVSHA